MDSRYSEKISFNQYDSYDNVLEQQKAGDMKQSYIWDYKSSLPIAEATNASVTDIAATSFESDGTGGFSYIGVPVATSLSLTGTKMLRFNK